MANELESSEPISPSAFMRQLRPEYYSDTEERSTYQLDAPVLEHHLETLTARNQTHDFELFCRKLCERAICPNLRPVTGPEGGGDGKVDTETTPVADEITQLYYLGMANSGRERWGFAFSAKRRWTEKVLTDVAGMVATGRRYDRIFCVTSRSARSKTRLELEAKLAKQYGIPVTIHDRSWIMKEVIENERKDLAFNYLRVGQEVAGATRLGPADYSRVRQLEDLEAALSDPERYRGMKTQRVAEALVAAKLSRNLERPRIETDGRFARAVRLADAEGTQHQRLEAHYERLWTAFWWFDDIAQFESGYDAFEALTQKSDHLADLGYLCNLAQLLFNIVIHRHRSASEASLDERIGRLTARLAPLAHDLERPNNALQARMELLQLEINRAILERDRDKLPSIWPRIAQVLADASGLGEFPAEKVTHLIEVFGMVAGSDAEYAKLVDQTAAFVAERKSEGEGALVLLNRAKQLTFDDRFEMIRLLGKAAYQLSKKEYADAMIEATRLLSLAYRSAGLLWAARASCMMAIASIFIETEEEGHLPASVVPTLMILAWICVELRHLPDAFEAIRLVRGCMASLPLTGDSKAHAEKRFSDFDLVLAVQLLNASAAELEQMIALPDVLRGLGLHNSAMALLYVLGYEDLLREHGAIPPETSNREVAHLYNRLAAQPAAERMSQQAIFNLPGSQVYASTVLGIAIEVRHQGTDSSCLAAEALVGTIEALFATTLDFQILPHTERFEITLEEVTGLAAPDFTLQPETAAAHVRWPMNLAAGTFTAHDEIHAFLLKLSGSVMIATCVVPDVQASFARLFHDDGVLHRISMVLAASNSHSRLLKTALGRLSDWTDLASRQYPLLQKRPVIAPEPSPEGASRASSDDADRARASVREVPGAPQAQTHRDITLHSVIDIHLWNRAEWLGTVFFYFDGIPALGLRFQDEAAGREIFARWRERFGDVDRKNNIYLAIIRGVSIEHPAHYRVMITAGIDRTAVKEGQLIVAPSRIKTLEPATDTNIQTFLDAYARTRQYIVLPAEAGENGLPKPRGDHAILKRHLSIKLAKDVKPGDPEMSAVCIGREGLRTHGP